MASSDVADPCVLFLVGGARSGKSRLAVELARGRSPVLFVATARRSDDEMRARIARHREERPGTWGTLEAPVELPESIRRHVEPAHTVILDCLTLWVANLLTGIGPDEGDDDVEARVLDRAEELVSAIAETGRRWIVISNEVGAGLHPDTPLGRRYRDLLGLVNQRMAVAADRALLVVAGQTLELEEPGR